MDGYSNGVLKGLKAVQTECGLWPIDGQRFLRQCTIRSASGKLKPNSKCLQRGNCCARVLLATQSDLQAQNGELQKAIEAAGYLVLFYLPFHLELNFIQYFWGAAKQYTREHCEYSFPALQRLVLQAIAQIPNHLIWKYANRTKRIVNGYETGAIYRDDRYKSIVHTKHKSHRRV